MTDWLEELEQLVNSDDGQKALAFAIKADHAKELIESAKKAAFLDYFQHKARFLEKENQRLKSLLRKHRRKILVGRGCEKCGASFICVECGMCPDCGHAPDCELKKALEG